MAELPADISVVGLGKLGAPLAACLASKGFTVTGLDLDASKVRALQAHRAPVLETGLQEMIELHGARLRATQDYNEIVQGSGITFVVVPTPSASDGGFSLRFALPACEQIGQALRRKQAYHLVVMTSTVMPGATEGPLCAALEQASGKRCGPDFGLCYNPEFIALGSVLHDFLNPDFVLIGESDARAGELLESVYRKVCAGRPAISRMNFVNAELTKLSVNTFVTTKITFANMLAGICSRLPGADVDTVTAALGQDSRIGRKYLKGAVGYGGPCFPRDNKALSALARQLEVPALLAEATDHANTEEVCRMVRLIEGLLHPREAVGILGLSYKPQTEVVEASQGMLLAQALVEKKIPVVVYDPAGLKNAQRTLPAQVRLADSMEACARACDVLVITTAWSEFLALDPAQIKTSRKPRVVIDPWRMLNAERFREVADFVALGRGPRAKR